MIHEVSLPVKLLTHVQDAVEVIRHDDEVVVLTDALHRVEVMLLQDLRSQRLREDLEMGTSFSKTNVHFKNFSNQNFRVRLLLQ